MSEFEGLKGWVPGDRLRVRLNPNRTWYNAMWQPETITQRLYLKLVPSDILRKWVSLHPTIKIEDSDDSV